MHLTARRILESINSRYLLDTFQCSILLIQNPHKKLADLILLICIIR